MDKSCCNTDHVLSRYVIYQGEKHISRKFTDKDQCQFCKEQLGNSPFYCESSTLFSPRFWHCVVGLSLKTNSPLGCKKCNNGCYDVCGSCYVRGAGCLDRTHSLLKCAQINQDRSHGNFRALLSEDRKDHLVEYLNEKRSKMGLLHK